MIFGKLKDIHVWLADRNESTTKNLLSVYWQVFYLL